MLCSQFVTIHVTCFLPKNSIPFSVDFPVHVQSRYLLSHKDQNFLQSCVPSSCPFTFLAVSQRPVFPSVLCSQFVSIHFTFCLPKSCFHLSVVFPVCVHSRYLQSPKDQNSLQWCFPSLCPFTLLAVSQRQAFPSVLCSQIVSFLVNCCHPMTSISFSFLFPICDHLRHLLSPKTSFPFCVVFPVCVHSRYVLSHKEQHSH